MMTPLSVVSNAVSPALFLHVEQEMQGEHIERNPVIRSLLVALIARQHVILLGPPGTGKSRLARDLCSRLTGAFFEWQLTRLSTPEELFGPISLQGLQQDRYRRIPQGKLPEADIAYLDETFKASSAILNTLLAAMNERVFFNDGQAVPMPLIMLIGASNELPEDRGELGALWDRFLVRQVVDYVQDPQAFAHMLHAANRPAMQTQLSLTDLQQAQSESEQIDIEPVLPLLGQLRAQLAGQGLIVSDRRWRQSLGLIQADAWLNGHATAAPEDVLILQHVLWESPDQRMMVAKQVMALISPYDQEAQDILDDARDAVTQLANRPSDEDDQAKMMAALETSKVLKDAKKRLEQVIRKAQVEAGTADERAKTGLDELEQWGENIMKNYLRV